MYSVHVYVNVVFAKSLLYTHVQVTVYNYVPTCLHRALHRITVSIFSVELRFFLVSSFHFLVSHFIFRCAIWVFLVSNFNFSVRASFSSVEFQFSASSLVFDCRISISGVELQFLASNYNFRSIQFSVVELRSFSDC